MNQNSGTVYPVSSKLKTMEVTPGTIICTIISILTYIADVVLDVRLAIMHFNDGNQAFFVLTVIFIAIPAATMTAFSLCWYIYDSRTVELRVSIKHWIIRIIFLVFCLAPVLRNFEALYYAWKSSKNADSKEFYTRRMLFTNTDASLLRLFEAFMECGPQLVLQLYIFAYTQSRKPNVIRGTDIILLVSVSISSISMSSAIATYLRSLRSALDDKSELSYSMSMFVILWRFFEISARVLALGLFASVFPQFFWFVCLVHFIVMSIFICTMNTQFCDNHWGECLYNLVLSVMFTFCYFNPKDSPTRRRCIFFYSVMFLENTALMIVWFHFYTPKADLKQPAMIVQFLSFALGVAIMILYYMFFHPTTGIMAKQSINRNNVSENRIQGGEAGVMLREMRNKTEEAGA